MLGRGEERKFLGRMVCKKEVVATLYLKRKVRNFFFVGWAGVGGGVGMRVYIVYDKFSPTPTVLTFLLQPLENLPSSLQFFIFFMHKIYDVYYTSILHYFMHISGREVL